MHSQELLSAQLQVSDEKAIKVQQTIVNQIDDVSVFKLVFEILHSKSSSAMTPLHCMRLFQCIPTYLE